MGFEREGSRGGFFQLFDWTAKSRKKLFSSKPDFPGHSKQGKRSDGNFPSTRLSLIGDDEIGIGTSFKGTSDFSCASSVTDEDGCGSRAPSVVARLMGLDSLPTNNFQEAYSTPFFDTRSLQDSKYHQKNFEYYNQHQVMYGGNVIKKDDGQSSRSFIEPKVNKKATPSRPIEKFQTEVLPPKSAKSIPVTHHKLLSPIKSPGFIPSNDAAHIMEAAAKIIDPGPHCPAKSKMPLGIGSSSVPLKVQALKERVEAAQKAGLMSSSSSKVQESREKAESSHRTSTLSESSQIPVESNAAKYLKGQSMTKSWNGSTDAPFRPSLDKEEGSSQSKNKGKSISLAIQAKVNVQKREGLSLSSNRSEVLDRQQSDAKSSPTFRSKQNTHKGSNKKSSNQNPSGVLRQNNQEQNIIVEQDDSLSKPLVSNSQSRKLLSRDSSCRQKGSNRTGGSSKTGARKSSFSEHVEKDAPYSSARNFSRKKRSIDGDLNSNKTPSNDKSSSAKTQKPIKASPVSDSNNWADESRRKGLDVVSFTFTAPLTRSESFGQVGLGPRKNGFPVDNLGKRVLVDSDSKKVSSLAYNVIGGDALSLLLEEKLRELSLGLESCVKTGSASSSASSLENVVTPSLDAFGAAQRMSKDQFEFSTTGQSSSMSKQSFQLKQLHYLKGQSEIGENAKFLSNRLPSPVSILESSFSNESYGSTITAESHCSEGSNLCSSVQAQEMNSLSFPKKLLRCPEADTELSDSASSTSTCSLSRNHKSTLIMLDTSKATSEWELEYVNEILFSVEVMFNDFALGRSREIVNPHLFNLLEARRRPLESSNGVGATMRLRRKAIFDCVSECLDIRCKRFMFGGYTMWSKGVDMVRRKACFAEELYKEISGWERLSNSMVDELVDKDMSCKYGKWLDYEEVDGFVVGVEIEAQIFDSLISELVAADMF